MLKFNHKLNHNLLPAYFLSFIPTYTRDHYTERNLRFNTVRLPSTTKKFFTEGTKYQFAKFLSCTPSAKLTLFNSMPINVSTKTFKHETIDAYDPTCTVRNCYVCSIR